MAIEIVELAINSMVDLSIVFSYVYQRVPPPKGLRKLPPNRASHPIGSWCAPGEVLMAIWGKEVRILQPKNIGNWWLILIGKLVDSLV